MKPSYNLKNKTPCEVSQDPRPFDQWLHSVAMFVKQSIYDRILIDYTTNRTSKNVKTKIKLKP